MELLQQFEENFNRLLVTYETLQNEYNALQQKYEHQWEELLQNQQLYCLQQDQYMFYLLVFLDMFYQVGEH